MGGLFSFFRSKPPPQTPATFPKRIKNLILNQSRGIIGVLIPLIVFGPQFDKDNKNKSIEICWMSLAWMFLIHPVNVPMIGIFPIFFLPLCGVMPSKIACTAYFSDNMVLFIIGGMVHQLWNNSGLDRRIALSILSSGSASGLSATNLLCKASMASFFLSIFSNKLLVTSYITHVVTSALMPLEVAATPEIRYAVNNGVQTASSIGSIVILHGSIAVIGAKMCYDEGTRQFTKAETFNYLQYGVVSFIAAVLMGIVNFIVHSIYIKVNVKNDLDDASKTKLQQSFSSLKSDLGPSVTGHEFLTLFFSLLFWALLFTRSTGSWNFGWAKSFGKGTVTDSCVCAGMLILLSVLPKTLGFMKYFGAKKRSDLPPLKPEASILFWRFINANTIYGYIFLLGVGAVLTRAAIRTDVSLLRDINDYSGKFITDQSYAVGMLFIVLISAVVGNIITSTAACVVLAPFALCATALASGAWSGKCHFACLAVGHATTLGFSFPFLHTPAYFCHHVGKVPIMKMVKISFFPVFLCSVALWVNIVYIAPKILPAKSVDLGAAILQAILDATTLVP